MRLLFRAELVKPLLAWFGILVVLGLLAALIFIHSGVFNVAATVEDAPPLRWVLVTTREASVRRHARGIEAPDLSGAQRVESGFRTYRDACAMCHAAPGRDAFPMAQGLNPQAPSLAEKAEEMSAAELYWVIKNGIRFTGMPAWGGVLSDREIWDVVAFIQRLPDMTAADYDALGRRVPPRRSP